MNLGCVHISTPIKMKVCFEISCGRDIKIEIYVSADVYNDLALENFGD